MRINVYLTTFYCLLFFYAPLTTAQICNPSSTEVLDANEVSTTLLNGGDSWWDLSDGQYIVPKPAAGEDPVTAIFAGAIWIGGFDDAGNLKLAAQTYRQNGNDYWPGPILNTNSGPGDCILWNRHHKVYGSEIDALRNDFADNGVIDNVIPTNILGWPGRGNSHFYTLFGFDLPDQDLAPFFDQQNDGIYNPEQGDYPILGLEGCAGANQYADQMIWHVINDIADVHQSGGDQLGLEIQVMSYSFNTPGLEYTTFYTYDLINKQGGNLNDMYFGQFVDPDLGCWIDDFVGSDPSRSMAIAYNGEAIDSDCQDFAGGIVNGYGNQVPLLGFDILKGAKDQLGNSLPMSSFITYDNSGGPTSHANSAAERYRLMTGLWRDGSPVEYGGNGFQQGTYATSFMYSGDPTDTNGWSECSVGNNPNDRRFIMASGPFNMPMANQQEITVGVVFVPDVAHPCPSFMMLQKADDFVQAQFDDCFGGLLSSNHELPVQVSVLDRVQLVPNPSFQNGVVRIINLPENSIVEICTIEGRPLQRIKSEGQSEGGAVVWDLTTESGRVASGLYFVRVISGDAERVLKLSVF